MNNKQEKMSGGYIIEREANGNEKIYDPRSALIKDRIILVIGEVEEQMAADIVAKLLYLDSISNEKITLMLNTPGGCVVSGNSVVDTMRFIKSPVETINIGNSCSMGSIILSAGDSRKALPMSQVMIHQVSSSARGTIQDQKMSYEHSVKLNEMLMAFLAERCGKTIDEIKKAADRDFWMGAEEALEFGIIDEIIKPNDKKKKKKK